MLGRLPATVKPQVVKTLPDGSHLALLTRRDEHGRQTSDQQVVRIVSYTVTDPHLVGYGEPHRLVTTLLDPVQAEALDLAETYHERWESELVIDELDTHQRLAGRVLRSQSPVGVVQELYGLLLAHYAVRVLMHQAAQYAALDPDGLSFVSALELVRDAITEFQMTRLDELPRLLLRLFRDIAAKQLPARRARVTPRVVKRKMSKFKRKRAAHRPSVPLQQPFHQSLALI